MRPALLVCGSAIIVCCPIARAIIAHNRVILIGRDENNPLCSEEEALKLAEALQNTIKYLTFTGRSTSGGQLPFELKALEALLLLTVRGFGQVVGEIEERVYAKIPEVSVVMGELASLAGIGWRGGPRGGPSELASLKLLASCVRSELSPCLVLVQLRFGVSPIELRDLLEAKRTVDDCVYSGRALQSAIAAVLSEGQSNRAVACLPINVRLTV